ncbi:precorrin-6A reductase [Cetobacterium sp. SF1]|uniref:precorrin-6A reductase n=1 Tax=Cetobacterium sp. SF1 TaxID=3417654 RepID=UPI003CFB5867
MIWIIGGTKDSRDFVDLYENKKELIVTTATEYGGKLLEDSGVKVLCKRLLPGEMDDFIEKNKIYKIIDLSHPYAVEVSQNAIEASKRKNIRYVRFERENLEFQNHDGIIEFYSVEEIVKYLENLQGNILITLGSNNLEKFKDLKNISNLYFRILPKWEMIKKAEDLGILPKNIIAMQGPFTYELNLAMMKQLDIKYMVSKKGGDTGGEREKIEATKDAGAISLLLDRPKITYPEVYSKIEDLI